MLIFILIMFISLIFVSYALGKTKARNKKIFWINNIEDKNKLVEIYREQDFILLCPCYVSTNSITIDNRQIVKKSDMNCILQCYTFKTANLVIDQFGKIHQNFIINNAFN